jgi:hypothetical protein
MNAHISVISNLKHCIISVLSNGADYINMGHRL